MLCLKRNHPLPTLQIPTQIRPPKIHLTKVRSVVTLADVPPGHRPVRGVDPGIDVVLRSGQFLDLGHHLDALQQILRVVQVNEGVGPDPLP